MSIRLISNTTDKVLLMSSYMSHVVVPPRGSYQYNPWRSTWTPGTDCNKEAKPRHMSTRLHRR